MATYVNNDSTESRLQHLEVLRSALSEFKHAVYRLDSAWSSAILPTEVDFIGNDAEIPFTYSYDEWATVVYNWIIEAENDVERLISETEQGI